jgi:hypothetical protein
MNTYWIVIDFVKRQTLLDIKEKTRLFLSEADARETASRLNEVNSTSQFIVIPFITKVL